MSYFQEVSGRVGRRLHRETHLRQLARTVERTSAHDPSATPYIGLTPASLCLDAATFNATTRTGRVNIFLPSAQNRHLFAGGLTALRTAARIAMQSDLRLQIVSFEHITAGDIAAIHSTLLSEFGFPLDQLDGVCDVGEASELVFTADDLWIATMWTTAHCLDVLAARGRIDRERVIYLVQDYEPLFLPAGTDAALARATYHAGFVALINSSPLAAYLTEQESLQIPDSQVFAPELDFARLATAAESREPLPGSALLVYYRPQSQRNMCDLAMAAVRETALRMESAGREFTVATMGRAHGRMVVGERTPVTSLGRLPWADYFTNLTQYNVLLSLQATPHPSHPPLDMVASGGRSVTNEVGSTRSALHPRLTATIADPRHLADALIQVFDDVAAHPEEPHDRGDDFMRALGRPFADAVDAALAVVGR